MTLARIPRRANPAKSLQSWDWTGGDPDLDGDIEGSPGWWLDRLSKRLIARNPDMMMFTQYYAGNHRLPYAAEKLAFLMGPHFRRSFVNYCDVVVDKLIERLEVTGFQLASATSANEDAWQTWQRNSFDQEFAKGLREGAVKGEFSIGVWADKKGLAQMRIQDPLNVIVATDPEDRRQRRAALKRWFDIDLGVWHANLYLPQAIWKFQARTSPGDPFIQTWWEQEYWQLTSPWMTWIPRYVPGEEWPLPNPYNVVMVVPFPNKPDLEGVGISELNSIVPIQDKVNKLNMDLMLGSEYAAFPQRFATNMDLERDDEGNVKIPWKIGVDKIITAPSPELPAGPEVKFGQFSTAELANWITAMKAALQEIAVISRIPGPDILGEAGGGQPISGESRRAAEAGLVQKAKDRWRDFSEPLEIVMRLTGLIEGNDELAEAENLVTLWRDPEIRTESEHLNALTLMAGLGVPKKSLWARIPMTPTEIQNADALLASGDEPPIGAKETLLLTGAAPGATQPARPGQTPPAAPEPPAAPPPQKVRVTRDATGSTIERVP